MSEDVDRSSATTSTEVARDRAIMLDIVEDASNLEPKADVFIGEMRGRRDSSSPVGPRSW